MLTARRNAPRPEAETAQERTVASGFHTASYIADMAGDLAQLARSVRMELVAYLLDMARQEAEGEAVRHQCRERTETEPLA